MLPNRLIERNLRVFDGSFTFPRAGQTGNPQPVASYAFVGEPETNGVIERFFRTLKEQIVHGRIYQTIDEVRDAVRDFVARYNTEWLIEKNGLRSPSDTRAAWYQTVMGAAA